MKQSISRNGCAHMILKYSPKLVSGSLHKLS